MNKKILKYFAGVTAVMMPLSGSAYDFEQDSLSYTILQDREDCVEVSSLNGSYGESQIWEITVPDHVDFSGKSYKVVSIGENAFYFRWIDSVTLPETITSIERLAFFGCVALKYIKLPESLTHLGYSSVNHSPYKSLVIPNKVDTINCAFYMDTDLERLVLGKGVKVITGRAFLEVHKLKELYIMSPEPPVFPDNEYFDRPFYDCRSDNAIVYVPAEALDKYPRREEGEENSYTGDYNGYRVFDSSWKFFTDYRPIPDLFVVLSEEEYTLPLDHSLQIFYDTVNYAVVDVYSEKWEYDPEMVFIDGDIVTALKPGETTLRRIVDTSTGEYKSHDIKLTILDTSGVTLPTVDPDQSEPAKRLNADGSSTFYGIDGTPAGGNPDKLRPGVYIERRGNKTTKFIKR